MRTSRSFLVAIATNDLPVYSRVGQAMDRHSTGCAVVQAPTPFSGRRRRQGLSQRVSVFREEGQPWPTTAVLTAGGTCNGFRGRNRAAALLETAPRRKLVLGHEDLMEPVLYPRVFTGPGWIFEMQVDGYRALARSVGGQVSLISHTGREMGTQFPEIIWALASIPGSWHLDAELVVPNERGQPDWERLRRRSVTRRELAIAAAARAEPATLCVFDILTLGRTDLRDLSTEQRKARLAKAIPPTPGVRIISSLDARGDAAFAKACGLGLEGVVAKRSDAPYQAGKRPTWRKIKNPSYSR